MQLYVISCLYSASTLILISSASPRPVLVWTCPSPYFISSVLTHEERDVDKNEKKKKERAQGRFSLIISLLCCIVARAWADCCMSQAMNFGAAPGVRIAIEFIPGARHHPLPAYEKRATTEGVRRMGFSPLMYRLRTTVYPTQNLYVCAVLVYEYVGS